MAVPAVAQSDIGRISIIANPDRAAPLGETARGIQHVLQQAWPELTVEIIDKENFIPNQTQPTLVIALGDAMLPWLAEHPHDYTGAIAFYVSTAAFAADKKNVKLTALYREQPLSRQLQLAKLLIPNLHSVAIIRGNRELPQSAADLRRSSGIDVIEAPLDLQSEWPKLLSQLMHDNDVLLGIDDSQLYNSDNIRSILLTAYRHGKGLIGPSRAFVNAGSLASCYTGSEQYLQQLIAMVGTFLNEHKLPGPQYPKAFRVAVNPQVALSLGLSIPDEKTLSAWAQNQFGDCGDGC